GRRSGPPRLEPQQPGPRARQGYRQLVGLVEQGPEALVFGEPCADLGEQLLGDVGGAGLAALLAGEALAGVGGAAVVAGAGGAAAAVGVGAEGGGQHGGSGGQPLEAAPQHAEDVVGVVGDARG